MNNDSDLTKPDSKEVLPVQKVRRSQHHEREKWNQILADWEASGLSQIDYCNDHGIKLYRLQYYRNKKMQQSNKGHRMIPIEVTNLSSDLSSTSFVLTLHSGAKLSIPQNYNANDLKRLLQTLGV